MKIFVTKPFARFAKREGIEDEKLCEAVRRAEEGGIDANLGGSLIKQRIGRRHGGKAGGFRVLLSFRKDGIAVFLAGFAKSDKENIRADERAMFRKLASVFQSMDLEARAKALESEELVEIICHDKAVQNRDAGSRS